MITTNSIVLDSVTDLVNISSMNLDKQQIFLNNPIEQIDKTKDNV